jgi:hypothetical protein
VYYVDALIGDATIDTMPVATFDAYRDHGRPARRLEDDLAGASRVLEDLRAAGIDLAAVIQRPSPGRRPQVHRLVRSVAPSRSHSAASPHRATDAAWSAFLAERGLR